MSEWMRRVRDGVVTGVAVLVLGGVPIAQEFPAPQPSRPQPQPQRLIVRNVEGRGTYRSVVHSLRQWRGQNNAITTETVDCDMSGEFFGGGDAKVTGTIAFLRETTRDGRRIGRTEIRGSGNQIPTHHSVRLGFVPGQPGGMMWARWTPDALEVPVEISIGDNAPIGHTLYCETRLKRTNQPYPLRGRHTGPLTSVDVMIKPSPIARPGGQMLRLEQTVDLTWNFAPL
jgi:hypothetical protein